MARAGNIRPSLIVPEEVVAAFASPLRLHSRAKVAVTLGFHWWGSAPSSYAPRYVQLVVMVCPSAEMVLEIIPV